MAIAGIISIVAIKAPQPNGVAIHRKVFNRREVGNISGRVGYADFIYLTTEVVARVGATTNVKVIAAAYRDGTRNIGGNLSTIKEQTTITA